MAALIGNKYESDDYNVSSEFLKEALPSVSAMALQAEEDKNFVFADRLYFMIYGVSHQKSNGLLPCSKVSENS